MMSGTEKTMPSPISTISRREMIQAFGGGFGALGLASLLAPAAAAADSTSTRAPHFKQRAKRVIQLFMNGGPFGPDLLDPKPAINKHAGRRPKEVELRTENQTGGLMPVPFGFAKCGKSGIEVSELLPHLGKCIDDVCVVRSLHADNINHSNACLQMTTGEQVFSRPSLGSWVLYGLGSESQNLPGFVAVCTGSPDAALWGSSF